MKFDVPCKPPILWKKPPNTLVAGYRITRVRDIGWESGFVNGVPYSRKWEWPSKEKK